MADPPLDPIVESSNLTKNCGYCGKENAEEALACVGCGTSFPIVIASVSEGHPTETGFSPTQLNARSATWILFISIAAEVGTTFALALFLAIGESIVKPQNLSYNGVIALSQVAASLVKS
jgi:hypothetical protein